MQFFFSVLLCRGVPQIMAFFALFWSWHLARVFLLGCRANAVPFQSGRQRHLATGTVEADIL